MTRTTSILMSAYATSLQRSSILLDSLRLNTLLPSSTSPNRATLAPRGRSTGAPLCVERTAPTCSRASRTAPTCRGNNGRHVLCSHLLQHYCFAVRDPSLCRACPVVGKRATSRLRTATAPHCLCLSNPIRFPSFTRALTPSSTAPSATAPFCASARARFSLRIQARPCA